MTATIDISARGTRGRAVAVAVPVVCVGLILTAILTVVLSIIGLVIGLVLTAVVTAVRVRTFGRSFDRRILEPFTTIAAESSPAAAGLCNLAEGLATSVGVDVPDLRVLADPGCNVLVVDGGTDRAVVIVTSGLLEALTRVELEGVVARALVQIRQGDAAAVLADLAIDRAPDVKVLRNIVGGPSVTDDPDRAVLLDRAAVSATRYPPGLEGALDACRRGTTAVAGADASTAALWLADPLGRESLDHRVAALGLL